MKSMNFATLLERFFIERLMRQRQVSPHTVLSRHLPPVAPFCRPASAQTTLKSRTRRY